jgi:chaperonin cofactor prefoldin
VSAPEDKQSRNPIANHNRHTGLLFQGLACELHFFSETLKFRLDQLHHERRAYMDQQFDELRACITDAYAHLNDRIERLDQRVRNLEQR